MSSGESLGEIGLMKSGSWSHVLSTDRLEEVVLRDAVAQGCYGWIFEIGGTAFHLRGIRAHRLPWRGSSQLTVVGGCCTAWRAKKASAVYNQAATVPYASSSAEGGPSQLNRYQSRTFAR
jgi:hypothetical protein